MLARYRKSVAALLGSVATWGLTAGADGTYDQVELWGLLAALAAVFAVWGTPNDVPAGAPRDPGMSERGESGVIVAVGIVGIVLILLLLFMVF